MTPYFGGEAPPSRTALWAAYVLLESVSPRLPEEFALVKATRLGAAPPERAQRAAFADATPRSLDAKVPVPLVEALAANGFGPGEDEFSLGVSTMSDLLDVGLLVSTAADYVGQRR